VRRVILLLAATALVVALAAPPASAQKGPPVFFYDRLPTEEPCFRAADEAAIEFLFESIPAVCVVGTPRGPV